MSLIEKMQSRLDDALLERTAAHERMNRTEILLDEANERERLAGQREDIACEALDAALKAHKYETDKAESELFALGVQVAALKERLRLAEAVVDAARAIDRDWVDGYLSPSALNPTRRALAAFDAVPGDVSQTQGLGAPSPSDVEPLPEPDTRPRYASGEVPMVGDVVFITSVGPRSEKLTVVRIDEEGDPYATRETRGPLDYPYCARFLTLVRRAAPPASKSAAEVAFGNTADLLARAVALLREHQYDVRVREFLADFDKGGV